MNSPLQRRKKENYGYQKWVYFNFQAAYKSAFPKAPWIKEQTGYFMCQRIKNEEWMYK